MIGSKKSKKQLKPKVSPRYRPIKDQSKLELEIMMLTGIALALEGHPDRDHDLLVASALFEEEELGLGVGPSISSKILLQ